MNKFYEMIVVALVSVVITTLTYVLGLQTGWITEIDKIEFIGVALNYTCVILTVRQNIWAWPVGIVAVIFLGILFWNYSLYSSLALSILYFLPVQFLGWWAWLKAGVDDPHPGTELRVSSMSWDQYVLLVMHVLPVYFGITYYNILMGGEMPMADTVILVTSVLAQYLLTWKKLESWVLWIAVNIVSIYVYGTAGAFLLAVQYMLFLLNAFYGLVMWKKDMKNAAS